MVDSVFWGQHMLSALKLRENASQKKKNEHICLVSLEVYTCIPITLCLFMAIMESFISKAAATTAECWSQSYSKFIPMFVCLFVCLKKESKVVETLCEEGLGCQAPAISSD